MIRLALLALLAAPAAAQTGPTCFARDQVVERLANGYGETLRDRGMMTNGAVMEVFAADGTGTWTVVISAPGGQSCLVASGSMWTGAKLGEEG